MYALNEQLYSAFIPVNDLHERPERAIYFSPGQHPGKKMYHV